MNDTTNVFKDRGTQYVEDFSDSEDAWEHALSCDPSVIAALHGLSADERAEAADEFGEGFAEATAELPPTADAEKQNELALAASAFTGKDGYEWLTEGADDAYLSALNEEGVKAYVIDYADIIWGGAAHLPMFEELTVSEFIAMSDFDAAVTAVTEAVKNAQERVKENKMEVVKTKVILVGRHVSDLPTDIEVVEQRNVTWPLDAQECGKQWSRLGREAYDMGAALLLQNVPGVLAVAIARGERLAVEYETNHNPKWGVIVSVPGPRTAGVVTEYTTAEPSLLVKALNGANGRAKIEIVSERRAEYDSESESAALINATVRLTVDPVAEFKFDHIEWM